MARHSFARGAGYPGHRRAIAQEIALLTTAAHDRRATADRLRTRLSLLQDKPPSKGKSAAFVGAQLTSIQTTLQKAVSEAEFFEPTFEYSRSSTSFLL